MAAPQPTQTLSVQGVAVRCQGPADAPLVLMLHGWPDTLDLWDGLTERLAPRWRCARLTWPGFDPDDPMPARSLEALCALLREVVDTLSPQAPVVLVLHDWGCLFGYEFAMRHPDRVARVVGADVGDFNSGALWRSWNARARAGVMGYQLWLALAWGLGRLGARAWADALTRRMARWLRCPAPAQRVHHGMNAPYAMQWFGALGGLRQAQQVRLNMPLLFVYGERKPFMFHSKRWLERVAARPGNAVLGLANGHWVMCGRSAQAFEQAVQDWLAREAPPLRPSAPADGPDHLR